MDKQIWVGRFLKILRSRGFHFFFAIIVARFIIFCAIYLLISYQNAVPEIQNFTDFIKTFSQRWDGISYVFLADHGYVSEGDEKYYIAFPPLYPFLVATINLLFHNTPLVSVMLSNIFFLGGVVTFYKLLLLDYTKAFSRGVILILSFFPTSYYFSTSYPESLFFLLTVLCFFYLRKGRTESASLFAGLATLTRPFGILLWLPIFLEWWGNGKKPVSFYFLVIFFVESVGVYLFLNYYTHGDFFAFQNFLQSHWGKSFAFPWTGIIDSWNRGFLTTECCEYKYIVGFSEAITSTVAWIFIFPAIRRLKLFEAVYYTLGVIMMTSTGFILSTPRYLLSLPPFFIIINSLLKNRVLFALWLLLSTTLLIYLWYLFMLGHWVY